ncbi:deleted in malignant brain tumors 1 protein-like [Ylistrum balloti]|uniref:deleted in malignant brain tumors 1 protein-like n=1 Tax=Ylistrum balloti TaxID=509963 RepID=UPI002905856B|nr:deleted in malignant brain tumors 1 protein-like [Ylistrum balloti]
MTKSFEIGFLSSKFEKFIFGILLILQASYGQYILQDIRLSGGSTVYEGRVEVKYNGTWGTVCNDQFDGLDAKVICKHMGYEDGVTSHTFGKGTGPIWLDNLQCTGTESNLGECPSNNIGSHNCDHEQDAGVICEPKKSESAALARAAVIQPNECGDHNPNTRLVGPNDTIGVGFVEVKYNNTWWAVCDDLWNIEAARVVCSSLCFDTALSLTGSRHDIDYVKQNVSQIFLLDDVRCTGYESDILACEHRGLGVHNCDFGEYASVTCTPIQDNTDTVPEPYLDCKDEQFTVKFSRSDDANLTPSRVTVRHARDSTSCNPTYSETTDLITMLIPFSECGTDINYNASHIFFNQTLIYNVTGNHVITRKTLYYVALTCAFPRNQTNAVNYTAVPSVVPVSSLGEFKVVMTLFEDDYFTERLSSQSSVKMRQMLSVSLELSTNSPELKIVARTCFATPSGQWTDSVHYTLFEEACEEDQTLAMVPINETFVGFRFEAFRFVGFPEVFIHCSSVICGATEKDELCDRSCQTGDINRRRRDAKIRKKRDTHEWIYTVSTGIVINGTLDDPIIDRDTAQAVSRVVSAVSTASTTKVTKSQNVTPETTPPNISMSKNAPRAAATTTVTRSKSPTQKTTPSSVSISRSATRAAATSTVTKSKSPTQKTTPSSVSISRSATPSTPRPHSPTQAASNPDRGSSASVTKSTAQPAESLHKLSEVEENPAEDTLIDDMLVENVSSASHAGASFVTLVMMVLLYHMQRFLRDIMGYDP